MIAQYPEVVACVQGCAQAGIAGLDATLIVPKPNSIRLTYDITSQIPVAHISQSVENSFFSQHVNQPAGNQAYDYRNDHVDHLTPSAIQFQYSIYCQVREIQRE
ncbi:hypothetical protein FVF58_20080 [Paraburkholderia panacisoli]|uniref:Uncharacterized protein n=1 Tax=Paraburkholderia panacisoli TaxID=2603818 RepID=A0A5B0H5X9_9BURK|nr:hypothetical protein [Paraburkholderia panacisoli]KAA1010638.1 hypothetical protein FVF58_20080 [Paraburkholderia panacisoli]